MVFIIFLNSCRPVIYRNDPKRRARRAMAVIWPVDKDIFWTCRLVLTALLDSTFLSRRNPHRRGCRRCCCGSTYASGQRSRTACSGPCPAPRQQPRRRWSAGQTLSLAVPVKSGGCCRRAASQLRGRWRSCCGYLPMRPHRMLKFLPSVNLKCCCASSLATAETLAKVAAAMIAAAVAAALPMAAARQDKRNQSNRTLV